MTEHLQERVERFVANNPGADPMEVLSQLGPSVDADLADLQQVVAEVLDEQPGVDVNQAETADAGRDQPDLPTIHAQAGVYATNVAEYDCWIPWQYIEGRKQPHAIYADVDDPYSWSNPDLWRDFEDVLLACDDPRLEGPGIVLQHEADPYADWADPFFIVDYDDVRDPETGAVHPTVAEHIEQADTYADVSTSGTGVHLLGIGQLPDDVKTIADAALPFHEAFPDAEIEVYDGKRFVAMTGDHVVETPERATESQAFLDDLVDEFVTEEERRDVDVDGEEWDPEFEREDLAELDETDEFQAVVDAIKQVRPRDVRLRSQLTEERADGTLSFDPCWETSSSGTRLGWDPDIGWIYRRGDVSLDAVQVVALEEGIIRSVHDYPTGEEWHQAVDELRERGAHVPSYEYQASASSGGSDRSYERVVECPAPADDLEEIDVDDVRERLRGDRYDAAVDHDGPTVWAHDPGMGKTTTAHLGAADRDRSLAFLFDKHRKAHEHRADGITPDIDLHLRGADQPRHDACARAAYEHDACPEHGDPSECPRMCPIYDLDASHPDRQAFDALAAELGPVRAHLMLEPHDGDECPWLAALQEVQDVDSLVGVHQYQRLSTVRDGRDLLVDESPATLADDRRLDVQDLLQMAAELEDSPAKTPADETLRRLGAFLRDVIDVVAGDGTLADVDPPAPVWDSYEGHDDAAGSIMRYVEPDPDEDWQLVEALVRAKRAYADRLLARIHDDEWDGTPLAIDAVFAAAAAAGLDETAVREAAGAQLQLSHCPRCGTELEHVSGRRFCEACEWDEHEDLYAAGDQDPARILAWIDRDDGGLVVRRLPTPADLPDDPLVLDATATPEKVAAFYGADEDDVQVHGREHAALEKLHTTQILDGQYHHSTLVDAVEEDRATARRIQDHLDRAGKLHDRPLIVGRREVCSLFDLPENAAFVHFHGARGLNFEECDAVVVVGAPHPRMDDLERTAELLAQGREDLRVGGEEHSPRVDCPNPPVYRKLRYEDDQGRGRAVATKAYSGLVGALFREQRQHEIEQLVHRIRPVLAEEAKHAYLITNVPTDLPVDEVATLEELTEPAKALFPLADGAVDLAERLADVATGEGVDGFRAASLVDVQGGQVRFRIGEVHRLARATGLEVSERTVRRWIDQLEDLGLVDAGEYAHRQGIDYAVEGSTLTRALSVLCGNAGVEVAIKRRLRALAADADSAAAWLRRAQEVIDVGGDRCAVDRPPDPAG